MGMLTDANGHAAGVVATSAESGVGGFMPNNSAEVLHASAFIDSLLEIDATWLAANPGPNLSLAPGLGNALAPVPEPQSDALLLAGLIAIEFRYRLALR